MTVWPGASTDIEHRDLSDFLRPLPSEGTQLSGHGQVIHTDPARRLAEGSIVDEEGRPLDRCRQWGQFVKAGPGLERGDPSLGAGDQRGASTRQAISAVREQVSAREGRAELSVAVRDELVNPIGTLHGGVTLWVAELLAGSAVASARATRSPASLTVSYLRPLVRGDVALFRAEVVSCGRRLAMTQVTGFKQAGKSCVVASVHHHGSP